jgi:EAL domain-containing protein (putative c-di-GMP-specific phosphodiesterase class I)
MLKAFDRPLRGATGHHFKVHLSVGIATTREASDAGELIRNADLAMYRAKDCGKGRFELFDPRMREAVLKRHGLKEELQKAIESEELAVDYQPIVELVAGEPVATEALVRWHHPGRGVLLPSEFVPLAEETGQIVDIGRFVLEDACRRIHASQQHGHDQLSVHVNVSAIELKDAIRVDEILTTLDRWQVHSGRLVLEITESVVQDDATALALRRLRNMGVRLALDDFGTGYSSLSYLRSLPLDMLKIAKPFVENLAEGEEDDSFVRMIIDLARALDLDVIAEGIETREQLDVLVELGCTLGQGFYLDGARPAATAAAQAGEPAPQANGKPASQPAAPAGPAVAAAQ